MDSQDMGVLADEILTFLYSDAELAQERAQFADKAFCGMSFGTVDMERYYQLIISRRKV